MISIENLRFDFLQSNPINLDISLQSIVKISGSNGAGKTSLLRVLSCISDEYSGTVKINNYNLRHNKDEFKNYIRSIFASDGLYNGLSVRQNISLWSARYSNIDLTKAAMSVFKLENYAHDKIDHLSRGLQRRVCLAGLITAVREIWIIDELDTYLDIETKEIMKEVMINRKENGIIIYTAHSDYFDSITDRVLEIGK